MMHHPAPPCPAFVYARLYPHQTALTHAPSGKQRSWLQLHLHTTWLEQLSKLTGITLIHLLPEAAKPCDIASWLAAARQPAPIYQDISKNPSNPTLPLSQLKKAYIQAHKHLSNITQDTPPMRLLGGVWVSTSGSTGQPKRMLHPFSNLAKSALAFESLCPLDSKDSVALVLPCIHISGIMALFRALLAGAHTVLWPQWEAKSLNYYGITHASIVVAQGLKLLECTSLPDSLHSLLLGGSSVSRCFLQKLASLAYRKASSRRFQAWVSYGMTETASMVMLGNDQTQALVSTSTHVSPQPEHLESPLLRFLSHAEAWFEPYEPDTQQDTQPSNLLQLWVLSPLAQHAIQNKDGQASSLSPHALNTKDLFQKVGIDSQGRSLYRWVARSDSTYKSGGLKVIPELLEKRLSALLKLTSLWVLPWPHKRFGALNILCSSSSLSQANQSLILDYNKKAPPHLRVHGLAILVAQPSYGIKIRRSDLIESLSKMPPSSIARLTRTSL